MRSTREKIGFSLIVLIGLSALSAFFLVDPVPQDDQYHSFSDERTYLGVPNALNVLSNVPLFLVGIFGLMALRSKSLNSANIAKSNSMAYWSLFSGVTLVSLGSGYYHLWPGNTTLIWDRLPMTVAFMSLFSIVISEFISEHMGRLLHLPLLSIGMVSVLYWGLTESQGAGDLRPYVMVQFFPMIASPVILLSFKSKFNQVSCYWVLFFSYVLAKIFEYLDSQTHHFLVFISGHGIKHILPAIGLYILIRSYKTRACMDQESYQPRPGEMDQTGN